MNTRKWLFLANVVAGCWTAYYLGEVDAVLLALHGFAALAITTNWNNN